MDPLPQMTERIETAHEKMLNRVKATASRLTSRSPLFHRLAPVILILLTIVFVIFGATCFYLFEGNNHELKVRKWYMNTAVERRQFARSISARIFNDTRNLLIIIDREQTERVQQLLVESLKRYEEKLEVAPPSRKEWTFLSSVNFAYSLIITVGSGYKSPQTLASKIFLVPYVLIGVPLFYFTLFWVVYRLIAPILQSSATSLKRRLFLFTLVVMLYVLWASLLSLVLYYQVIPEFWRSIFVAFTSALTIQMPSASTVSPCCVFFLLLSATISVSLALLAVLILITTFLPHEALRHRNAPPLQEKIESMSDPPKFQVVVNEAGASRLTTD